MNQNNYVETELELENYTVIEVRFNRPFTAINDFDIRKFISFSDTDNFEDLEVCAKYDSGKFKPITHFRERNQKRIIKAVENWLSENEPELETFEDWYI